MANTDLERRVGELAGKLKIWLETDKEHRRILTNSIEELFERIRKIDDTIAEIKLKLNSMEHGIVQQLLGFFITPRGSMALIIMMILLSGFYFGIDNISNLLKLVLQGGIEK